MRRSLLAAVLTVATATSGCQKASKPVGPAWPAPSATADDGGQSIDPAPTAVASSLESSKDDGDDKPAAAEIVAQPGAAAVEPEKPAVDTPIEPTSGEVIMSEEIIIEIEE